MHYFLEEDHELKENIKNIPDKMAFKIGEVAKILNIRPSILRFWENEFKELNPPKSRSHQRAYRHQDVKTALIIKKLLYKDRFSIEGARAVLKKRKSKSKGHNSYFKSSSESFSFSDFKDKENENVENKEGEESLSNEQFSSNPLGLENKKKEVKEKEEDYKKYKEVDTKTLKELKSLQSEIFELKKLFK